MADTDEILCIDKPAGLTSFGVVARVRRVLSERASKKVKVGHTGTLDPFATGLLILLIDKGTKRSDEFLKLDKVYEAEIILGSTSTTGDPEGEITSFDSDRDQLPDESEILMTLGQFVGQIKQRPPAYSAIKIGGKRAYKLAREGRVVEIPERTVSIYGIDLISYDYPSLKIRAHVSSGTYIRTLAEDIGKSLRVGAYCRQLRRTKVADYSVDTAKTLEDLGILS